MNFFMCCWGVGEWLFCLCGIEGLCKFESPVINEVEGKILGEVSFLKKTNRGTKA